MDAKERDDGLASSYRTYDEVQDARKIRKEISEHCEKIGIAVNLNGAISASAYLAEVDKLLLYLLIGSGNMTDDDEARREALLKAKADD